MKTKWVAALLVALVLALGITAVVAAVSGAAFTTFDPSVDGLFKSVCKNSQINCNIYGAKQYVWLNGGPLANGLGPDGQYFFAVLVPGGQPNPNDGGAKNLSDDYDQYTNRTFTVSNGEVSAYAGSHWLDSGKAPNCTTKGGCSPDGKVPFIRLYPYADTTNPGGVYILAICSLEGGYPVEPRDCKYDAFKVKEGTITLEFMLSGVKFEDMNADGEAMQETDPKLPGWNITITGTGFLGEAINATVTTDGTGAWNYGVKYNNIPASTTVYPAHLTICEVLKDGWTQSYPTPTCYTKDIAPAAAAVVVNLDFGNWRPVKVTACKDEDLDGSLLSAGDRTRIVGWPVALSIDGEVVDEQVTGADGCYSWTGLEPGGIYDVHEGVLENWYALTPEEHTFLEAKSGETLSYTFVNTEYVSVTACKVEDMDGLTATTEDQVALADWTVSLTQETVVVDTQKTGMDGCYTWTGLDAGVSYDVHEALPSGWFNLIPVDYVFAKANSGDKFTHTFINSQPVMITVYKYFDLNESDTHEETEGMLPGFEFCLYDSLNNLVSADDFFENPSQLACQVTGEDGIVSWSGLKPGTYTVKETAKLGWFSTGLTEVETTLLSSDSADLWFGNVTNCVGLTPGYWVNWRNHYSSEQFLDLLEGTIAGSIAEADHMLTSLGCDGSDVLHCMERFLLANQLTLNLTQHPEYPNPSGGSMFFACQVPGYEGNLGDWLDEALKIHDVAGMGYLPEEILWVKTMLDYFANLYIVFWP